jgi:hypothetical protein
MFKHPTIGDAYASFVAANPELLDIYLSWTNAEKLIREVTCGDVGLQGVKVIVPQRRFDRFLERLHEVKNQHMLRIFLGSRCSPEFLKVYLKHHPDLYEHIVEPGSYLSIGPEVPLLVKLHTSGLLPEEWRVRFVKHAQALALETPDVDFLSSPHIRALFTQSELAETLNSIQEDLLPGFSSIVEDWRFNFDSDENLEDKFAPLYEVLRVLRREFEGDPVAEALINTAEKKVDRTIQDLLEENSSPDEDVDYEYRGGSQTDSTGERNIFDDVDQ